MKLVDNKNNKVPSLYLIFTFVFLIAVTQACSSKKSAPPPPPTDQDPSGIYTFNGNGEATFTNCNGGVKMDLTKLKGIIQGGRFLFFDTLTNTVFDGNITTKLKVISGTADVYCDGNKENGVTKVAVSGSVTGRSSISLTLAAGTNFGGATIPGLFSVSFYDRPASNVRIDTIADNWGLLSPKDVFTVSPARGTSTFNMSNIDDSYTYVSNNNLITINCTSEGTVSVSNANKNIYTLADAFVIGDGSCATLNLTTGYTGFASVVDSAAGNDDNMWYAVTNGTFSVFAILGR